MARILTKDWKDKISRALKGRKKSPEHVAKVALAQRGIPRPWLAGANSHLWKGGVSKSRSYKQTHEARRRALKKNVVVSPYRAELFERLKAYFNYTCPCCLRSEPEITLTIDHIIPLSRGGEHTAYNIQPLCRSCNSSKRTSVIRYWLPSNMKTQV